jgi:VIT1/CCC1 family predicted Fe2+/Mn2+ transporter
MILAISNQLFIITIMSMSSVKYLPFSTTIYKPNFLSVIKNFAMLIIGGFVGVIHFFIYPHTWLVLVLIPISLAATYFLFATIGKYSWGKIISEYRED